MNLSAERMAFIRRQVESGAQLDRDAALDLQGHNDHLIQIWEARGRLILITEGERDQLKAENEGIKAQIPGWTKREIELIADCELLRKDAERYQWVRDNASLILDRKIAYQAETGFIKFDTMPARSETETAIDAAMSKEASHDA